MKEIRTALLVLLVLSILVGVIYPLLVTGIAQLAFPRRANGSLVLSGGRIVGSELVGQSFSLPQYIHGRPSFSDYDPTRSGGSNLAPTSRVLLDRVLERIDRVRQENGLPQGAPVPADLVLESGSGLDPDISVESALLQVARIARARGVDPEMIETLIRRHARGPFLGAFGERRVNVLRLNIALDELFGPVPRQPGEVSHEQEP
jgi:K+-transporting ATPase ATPase C chain